MTDMTSAVKHPTLTAPLAPVYTQCTAADKFKPGNGGYLLHYKNGASASGTVFINEEKATAPAASTPAAPAGATKWSDAKVTTAVGANLELSIWLDVATLANFKDDLGFVNLQHSGTVTTLTLAIFGPF